jgi:hypothetical protein
MSFLRRKWRGLRWRVAHDTHYLVFSAPPLSLQPPAPPNVQLVQLSDPNDPALELARTAMRAAGEADVVHERLKRGETFFGWRTGEAVVSFGWATSGHRIIGYRLCRPYPGRVFLYNFATLSDWRGHGLYPALLQQIRYKFSQDSGVTDLLVDARVVNLASLRGILKAGFLPIAHAAFRTIFERWQVDLGHLELSGSERAIWYPK